MLGKLINTYHVYTVHMSFALNGSSALERFKHGNVIEIRNRIMFNFYPGLPHIGAGSFREVKSPVIQMHTHTLNMYRHIHPKCKGLSIANRKLEVLGRR